MRKTIFILSIWVLNAYAVTNDCEDWLQSVRNQVRDEVDTLNCFWAHFSLMDLQDQLGSSDYALSVIQPRFQKLTSAENWIEGQPFTYSKGKVSFIPSLVCGHCKRQSLSPIPVTRVAVAHEMAHHLQKILGIRDAQRLLNPINAPELFFRLELQADCLAGAYLGTGNSFSGDSMISNVKRISRNEKKDFIEAVRSSGVELAMPRILPLTPEKIRNTYLHPSSIQRERWFLKGFESHDPGQCDSLSPTLEDLLLN